MWRKRPHPQVHKLSGDEKTTEGQLNTATSPHCISSLYSMKKKKSNRVYFSPPSGIERKKKFSGIKDFPLNWNFFGSIFLLKKCLLKFHTNLLWEYFYQISLSISSTSINKGILINFGRKFCIKPEKTTEVGRPNPVTSESSGVSDVSRCPLCKFFTAKWEGHKGIQYNNRSGC